jgi:Flp pilus assembly protein TadG
MKTPIKGPCASRRSERGAAALEFGIVVVLLMTLLLGVIDFGRALYTYHFVSNAARDGVRFAVVRGAECTSLPYGCPAAATDVQNYLDNVPLGLNPARMNVTTTWPVLPNSPAICSTTPNYPGCTVEVNVRYRFNFLFSLVSSARIHMSSTAQMVISH